MEKKIIFRSFNNWEYRAVCHTIFDNGQLKALYFCIADGEPKLEIYQGENYIPDSKSTSRSWSYSPDRIPKKWKDKYTELELEWHEVKHWEAHRQL